METLTFTALCNVASYLDQDDFLSFVSTCRVLSECRHDVRTLANVLANTDDLIESRALNFGSRFIRFYALKCAKDLPFMGYCALMVAAYEGNERPLNVLKPLLGAPSTIEAVLSLCHEQIPAFVAALKYLDIPVDIRRPIMRAINSGAMGFRLPSGAHFDNLGPVFGDYYRFEMHGKVPKLIERFSFFAMTIIMEGAVTTKERLFARMESKSAAGCVKIANVERATAVIETFSNFSVEFDAVVGTSESTCLCRSVREAKHLTGTSVRRLIALLPRPFEHQQKLDIMRILQQCGDYEMLKELFSGQEDEIPFTVGHRHSQCNWTEDEKAAQDELYFCALQYWPETAKNHVCYKVLIRNIVACLDRRVIDQALAIIKSPSAPSTFGEQSEPTPTILSVLSHLCSLRMVDVNFLVGGLIDAAFDNVCKCAHLKLLISRIGHHGLHVHDRKSLPARLQAASRSVNLAALKMCRAYELSRPELRMDSEVVHEAFSELLSIRSRLRRDDPKFNAAIDMVLFFVDEWPEMAATNNRHGVSVEPFGEGNAGRSVEEIYRSLSLNAQLHQTL